MCLNKDVLTVKTLEMSAGQEVFLKAPEAENVRDIDVRASVSVVLSNRGGRGR